MSTNRTGKYWGWEERKEEEISASTFCVSLHNNGSVSPLLKRFMTMCNDNLPPSKLAVSIETTELFAQPPLISEYFSTSYSLFLSSFLGRTVILEPRTAIQISANPSFKANFLYDFRGDPHNFSALLFSHQMKKGKKKKLSQTGAYL